MRKENNDRLEQAASQPDLNPEDAIDTSQMGQKYRVNKAKQQSDQNVNDKPGLEITSTDTDRASEDVPEESVENLN